MNPLEIGSVLAHYRVLEKIGEGGMGVVYRAHDVRLKRTVAIKMLRPDLPMSLARRGRFEREAHLLAALNHPNIAGIYGLEEHQGQFFLVLEFVEGATLAEAIGIAPLPPRQIVDIAKQIARAMEEAHDKGIIHRDLKPANVKIRTDGTVKVLDFGLAKALAEGSDDDPTISHGDSREGAIIGTPAYMSPEQACGGSISSATDVWAFGCVLFEMLSGAKAFQGASAAEIRAAVVRGEPQWDALPADVPATLRSLAKCCLERSPKNRLRHMGDAPVLLESALTGEGTVVDTGRDVPRPFRWRPVAIGLGLIGLCALSALAGARVLRRTEPPLPMRVTMAPPFQLEPSLGFGPSLTISPDGLTIVYVLETGTTTALYLKRLDEVDPRPIGGTQGARSPFFSPDSQWIGFYDDDDGHLKKVAVSGGEPASITDVDFEGGAAWAADNTILFASTDGLMRVSASGGTPERITQAGARQQLWPTLLPGGRVALFTSLPARGTFDEADIVAIQLQNPAETNVVLKAAYYPHYAASGHLVFVQGDAILAAPFDADRLQVTGSAVTLVKDAWISSWIGYADFAFSDTGTLVYISGGRHPTRATLVSVDRSGSERSLLDDRRAYRVPRVSPDGRQVAVTLVDQQVDIWTIDIARKTMSRLTDSPSWDAYPLWEPKMRGMAFSSMREGIASIYRQNLLTGVVEKLVAKEHPVYPSSWSPDGKLLAYQEDHPQTGLDIWIYSMESRTSQPFLRTPYNESHAEFSPDGLFIAYHSAEAGGQPEVYVRPYPGPHPRRKISTNGGALPRWGARGESLFYRVADKVMAVEMGAGGGAPVELFKGPYGAYDSVPNAPSFVMVKEMAAGDPPLQIHLVTNWFQALSRLTVPSAAVPDSSSKR